MTASLDQLLTTTPHGEGFRGEVPDGWQQGRSTFGGLVIGMMVRTAEGAVARPGQGVRCVSAELYGQVVPGPLDLVVSVLRAGSAVTTAQVMMTQGGEPMGHGVVVLGTPRPNMPVLAPVWDPAPKPWVPMEVMPPLSSFAPTFTQHFAYQSVGPGPFGGGAEPVLEGWVRPRVPCAVHDAAWVAAMVDTYWPPTAVILEGVRPVATVGFHLDLLADASTLAPDAPVLQRGRAVAGADGYVSEDRDVWSPDGRLLGRNRQLLVIIK